MSPRLVNEIERLTAERNEARDRVAMLDLEAEVITTERDETWEVINRVLALHRPVPAGPGTGYCRECITCQTEYPCNTVRAMDGEP